MQIEGGGMADPPRQCQPFQVDYCRKLPYNFTSFPNAMSHADVHEAKHDIEMFKWVAKGRNDSGVQTKVRQAVSLRYVATRCLTLQGEMYDCGEALVGSLLCGPGAAVRGPLVNFSLLRTVNSSADKKYVSRRGKLNILFTPNRTNILLVQLSFRRKDILFWIFWISLFIHSISITITTCVWLCGPCGSRVSCRSDSSIPSANLGAALGLVSVVLGLV